MAASGAASVIHQTAMSVAMAAMGPMAGCSGLGWKKRRRRTKSDKPRMKPSQWVGRRGAGAFMMCNDGARWVCGMGWWWATSKRGLWVEPGTMGG